MYGVRVVDGGGDVEGFSVLEVVYGGVAGIFFYVVWGMGVLVCGYREWEFTGG